MSTEFDSNEKINRLLLLFIRKTYMMHESQKEKLEEAIIRGEIETESGLSEEFSLTIAGDTRWNSHYKTLSRFVGLFSSVSDVLEYVEDEDLNSFNQRQASGLRIYFRSFDFVFHLQLMLKILGTQALHELSAMQIQEFGDRFSEVSSELLICITGLNPHDTFCDFDASKLRS